MYYDKAGRMTYRILMLSSIALAAPWNGADKNLARLIAQSDSNNEFRETTRFFLPGSPHSRRRSCTCRRESEQSISVDCAPAPWLARCVSETVRAYTSIYR